MQNIDHIPIIAVSYNSPDLIDTLLTSIRRYYTNQVYIVDGSHPDVAGEIGDIVARFDNAQFIPFGYNIHHGPGMTWAMRNLPLSGQVMFLDSDVEIIAPGFLESLVSQLEPHLYGVGDLTYPALQEIPAELNPVPYLSPACMLCNIDVMRQYAPPIKHGAPMVSAMLSLARAGRTDLVKLVDWVKNDFGSDPERIFIRHDWQGTVRRTKGYHYDTPQQTAPVFNEHVLAMMPTDAQQTIEFNCGDGHLARAYKSVNPACSYTGVEFDPRAVALARSPCDFVHTVDPETADQAWYDSLAQNTCWVIADGLQYMRDPAAFLARVCAAMPANGTLLACLPNMQHWSVQGGLAAGKVQQVDGGPASALRHGFTRATIFELFAGAGFQVTDGVARVGADTGAHVAPAIRWLAQLAGGNPEQAVQDAAALQYVIKAVPGPR